MPLRLPHATRALAHRNFRLYLFGQGLSLLGTWMQQIALAWLIYNQTKSPWLLGAVGFAGQIPSLLIAPFAGVLADHWNRHRTIIVTQTLGMMQAMVLAALVWSDTVPMIPLFLLSAGMGIVNAFDLPTRQAFLIDLIPDASHLPNAIALNSTVVNGARLLGPFLAGMVIAAWGVRVCIVLNAVSYLAVLTALWSLRGLSASPPTAHPSWRSSLWEGFAYSFRSPPIRELLLVLGMVSLAGSALSVVLPVIANEVLHGGPELYGLLTGGSGLGALGSAVYLASRRSVLGLGRHVSWATGVFGLGLLGLSLSHSIPLTVLLLAITGSAMMLQLAACNTLLQTIAPADKRGRVMSLYVTALLGTAPLGSLLAGSVAERWGVAQALQVVGVGCVLSSAQFARRLPSLREHVRPIYEQAGILPPPTTPIA